MTSLYNEEVKEEYLDQYDNEQTRLTYEYVLSKVAPTEKQRGKDLYEFTGDEVVDVFYDLEPFSIAAASTNLAVISSYIKWAIGKTLRTSNIDPLKEFDTSDVSQFVDDNKKIYVSDTELNELSKDLVNAQDEVIFRLAFEGIAGYQVSEMLNLKKQDIDFDTNTIKIITDDKYGVRENLKISNDCIRAIKFAMSEKEYHLKNGNSKAKSPIKNLVDSEYVVRNVITGRVEITEGQADRHTVYRRIDKLKEIFQYPYLTIKNIQRSGMIKMAKDLYIENGKLDKEELAKVAERFNIQKVKVGNKEGYNYSILKRILNLDNITKLYDIDKEKENHQEHSIL